MSFLRRHYPIRFIRSADRAVIISRHSALSARHIGASSRGLGWTLLRGEPRSNLSARRAASLLGERWFRREGIAMAGLTLDQIVNDGALWGLLAQHSLSTEIAGRLGDRREHDVDLAAPKLTISGDGASIEAVPHLIASVAPGPRTVRWAWALPELAELPAAALARRLRDFGQSQGVEPLTRAEVGFDEFSPSPEGSDETDSVAGQVAMIASQVIGEVPWFIAQAGETKVVTLLQGGPALPRPEIGDLMAALPEGLMAGQITDAPRAIRSLLNRIPAWRGEWGPAGVRISDGRGNVDVHLDGDGQVTEIEANS